MGISGCQLDRALGDGPGLGLGACLFVHCCACIAVSYFGQMNFGWYMHLAIVASLSQALGRESAEERIERALAA